MDARRGHDGPVGRIPQSPSDGSYLGGHLKRERNDPAERVIERVEYLAHVSLDPSAAITEQNGDLEQRDGADGERLAVALKIVEDSCLLAGELLWLGQPPYHHVRVEKVSKHGFRKLFAAHGVPEIGSIRFEDIVRDPDLPGQGSLERLP